MRRAILFLLLSLTPALAFSQQDYQSSVYLYNPMLFNPAYAGTNPYHTFMAGCRFQWVGIKGAPMTQYASFNTGSKKQKLGFGVHAINEIIGARMNQSIFVNVAYAVKLNHYNHRLALGLDAGIDFQQMDFTRLYVNPEDQADPYRINTTVYTPNVGFGLYYYGENFFAGVSVPRVFSTSLSVRDSVFHSPFSFYNQHLYLTGGYDFKISDVVRIRPSALVKLVPNAPVTFDVNLNVKLGQKLWLGTYYRYNESVGANFALQIGKKYYLGYAYDFPINSLVLNQWGSHEIMFGIDLARNRKRSPVSCFFN